MLAPLIALAAVAAPVPPVELHGIWQGTVGNLPVRACFARRESATFGTYYYLSQRRLIPLEAEEEGAGASYRETDSRDRSRPLWAIERADGDGLSARWTHGRRTLPVRLAPVARTDGEENPCGSLAFHQPRLEGVRTVSERASADGVTYSRIRLDHGSRFGASVETFALDGTSAAVRRINSTLGQALAGDPPEWFECLRTPLQWSPYEGGFDERLEPVMISSRWLSLVLQFDSFCGGNHPNSGQTYRTFDLASGSEIDLHDWFNERAVEHRRFEADDEVFTTLQPAFRDFILNGWTADPDCDDVVRSQEYWNIGLKRDRFVFSPQLPHVVQACSETFTLPLAGLGAFLTEEGARNLRELQQERAPPGGRPLP